MLQNNWSTATTSKKQFTVGKTRLFGATSKLTNSKYSSPTNYLTNLRLIRAATTSIFSAIWWASFLRVGWSRQQTPSLWALQRVDWDWVGATISLGLAMSDLTKAKPSWVQWFPQDVWIKYPRTTKWRLRLNIRSISSISSHSMWVKIFCQWPQSTTTWTSCQSRAWSLSKERISFTLKTDLSAAGTSQTNISAKSSGLPGCTISLMLPKITSRLSTKTSSITK